nr:ATP-binding protein [Mesorhizobium sp. WSM3862]
MVILDQHAPSPDRLSVAVTAPRTPVAHSDARSTSSWRPVAAELLIIDELGYLPFQATAHLFLQLVSLRHEKGSIPITSNRSVGEWGKFLATALWPRRSDRLLHHSTVIHPRG